jgi:hypothetical protein
MEKRQLYTNLTIAIVAASLGGTLSNQLSFGRPSQRITKSDMFVAEEYVLIDNRGKTRGTFATRNGSVYIRLTDQNEKQRLMLNVDSDGNPTVNFWDKESEYGEYGHRTFPSVNFWTKKGRLYATVPGNTAKQTRFAAIPEPRRGERKADRAGVEDIKYLQSQIDQLWTTVTSTRKVVNELIK